MEDPKNILIGEIAKGNIVISISEFNGQKYLDVRKYYDEDGEKKPTKKGIALNREQFEALFEIFQKEKEDILKKMS